MHYEATKWLCEKDATLEHFGPVQRQLRYKNRLCELKLESRAVQFGAT
jgi:hypothetical protein